MVIFLPYISQFLKWCRSKATGEHHIHLDMPNFLLLLKWMSWLSVTMPSFSKLLNILEVWKHIFIWSFLTAQYYHFKMILHFTYKCAYPFSMYNMYILRWPTFHFGAIGRFIAGFETFIIFQWIPACCRHAIVLRCPIKQLWHLHIQIRECEDCFWKWAKVI